MNPKIYTSFLLSFILYLSLANVCFSQNSPQKVVRNYPSTYQEAINKVISILDNETKTSIRDTPKFNVGRQFAYVIHENNLIDYKNNNFLKSCAKSIGKPYIHFEDVTSVILNGVWDKLNSDLELFDFENTDAAIYFKSIEKTIKKANKNKRLGYFSSLPEWLFQQEYHYNIDNASTSIYAKELAFSKKPNFYLGILYLLAHSNPYTQEIKDLLNTLCNNKSDSLKILNYNYKDSISTSNNENNIKVVNYSFDKISYQDFALKCYSIIYNKNFNSSQEYDNFLSYCNTNYLAKWKFSKTLTTDDYKKLILQPRKLLEILTLTQEYYYKNSGNTELFETGTLKAKPLIEFLEFTDSISTEAPYLHRELSEYYHNNNKINNKSINALKLIADKLTMEEMFDIINPNSTKDYNNTIKTDDFLDYKYLVGFVIVTQQERLLMYPHKDKVYDLINYLIAHDFISWPVEYFLTDLLVQINAEKAVQNLKSYFNNNPTEGSFTRIAILKSIIEYDFERNSTFIEEWYWQVQGKNFNYHPIEYQLILELLKEKDESTIKLYNKIINDQKFKK